MKKILYLVITGCLLSLASCVDLDQDPLSFITEEEYIQYPKDAESTAKAVTALYKDLWQGNYGFNCRIMRINVGADDMTVSPTKPGNVLNYIQDLRPSLLSNDADFSVPWGIFTTIVFNSNKIIEGTPIPSDPKEATEFQAVLGEAYFMRSLAYFYMVRLFGDCPLILKNADASASMPRSSVAEVYDQAILPGLEKAVAWLPEKSRSGFSSTPSKWAAKALLADVYMTMAGWPLKKGAEYYGKAAQECQDIINNSGLSLTPSYADLWKEALKEQANEHMFAMHHSAAQKVASQYGKSFYPTDFHPNAGWADYYANPVFMNKYPEDERKEWNFMTEWEVKQTDGSIKVTNYKDSKDGVPCISKYYDYDNGNPGQSAQSNGITPIYRYADVLLMYAEASALATGSVNAQALQCLQAVQQRAKSSLTATTDPSEFDKAVFAERGWEFFAEFKRWFDLVRREKLAEVKPTEWASSLYKANNHYYLPVPYEQIDLTGWTNNSGY